MSVRAAQAQDEAQAGYRERGGVQEASRVRKGEISRHDQYVSGLDTL